MTVFSVNRRTLLAGGAATLGAAMLNLPRPAFAAAALPAGLVDAAKKDAALNVIALSPNWVYGKMMTAFGERYGLKVDAANPEGSSSEELQAIRSLKGQDRGPDCVELAPAFAQTAVEEKLLMPYKVATWDDIPNDAKDPDGLWKAVFYGIITFAVNKNVVKNPPRSWADLLKPEYKGMISMGGSPLKAGDSFAAVMAASLANGGSLDNIGPGIEFFGKLNAAGNYNPMQSDKGTMVSGQTPIALRWDYLNLTIRDEEAGKTDFEVVVPSDGAPYGAYYCQAISAYAPHQNAAKLWQEYLYSDEGQLGFLAGYAHPIRFSKMLEAGVVPADIVKKLPSPEAYKQVRFASQAQITAAKTTLGSEWNKLVGMN